MLPERVRGLAVLGEVDAALLGLGPDAEPHEPVDRDEDRERRGEREHERDPRGRRLPSDLCPAAVGARGVHDEAGEHAGEESAPTSPPTMCTPTASRESS